MTIRERIRSFLTRRSSEKWEQPSAPAPVAPEIGEGGYRPSAGTVQGFAGKVAIAARTALGGSAPTGPGIVSQPSAATPVEGLWQRYSELKWLGAYTPGAVPMAVRELMCRSAQVSLGLSTLKSPIFGLTFYAKGGSDKARAYLEQVLLRSDAWRPLLWSILRSLNFGFSVAELIYDQGPVKLDPDGKGGESAFTLEHAVTIKRVRGFKPTCVTPHADETGAFSGADVNGQWLAPERCLFAVNQYEHEDPADAGSGLLGESVLDPAYPHFYSLAVNCNSLRHYLNSKGNPPLIGQAPNEWRKGRNSKGEDGKAYHCMTVLNEAVIAVKGGGACTLPSEFDKDGNQLWSLTTMDVKDRVEQFLPSIQHDENMILRAMRIPEKTVTQDNATGSYAMSDVHLDVFLASLEVIAQMTVLQPVNEIAKRLVGWTFGANEECPQIEATPLSRAKIETLLQTVQSVLKSKFRLPDGGEFLLEELLDPVALLRVSNLPMRRVEDVARKPAAAPEQPPAEPPTAPGEDPEIETDPAPAPAEEAPAPAEAASASPIRFEQPAPPAPVVNVNITNQIPESPPPTVNVAASAPTVVNQVPEGPAPTVNVAPVVQVQSPDVHVHPEVKAPDVTVNAPVTVNTPTPAAKKVTITTDRDGNATGATITPAGG